MESNNDHIFEAEHITHYLLSVPVRKQEQKIYVDAMQKLNIHFSEYEQMLWTEMLKSKLRMACIDAGLALKEPNNNVRRKIFTMLAILEASPNYTPYFLSRSYSFFYVFKLTVVGIRAVFRAVTGILIVKNIQRKCS